MRNILRSAILGAVVIAGTPVIANALVFNILAESSPFNPTNFGQIGAGENIFSGNIDGSCLIGSSAPDCSFGDTSDLFSFSLADDFEILGATFTVTNYVTNGFNGLFGTSLDNVSFRSDSGGFSTNFNGNTARDLTPSFFGQDAAGDFLLSVAVLGVTQDFNGSTIQGVGDIAFDYQLAARRFAASGRRAGHAGGFEAAPSQRDKRSETFNSRACYAPPRCRGCARF